MPAVRNWEDRASSAEPAFRAVLDRIPPRESSPLASDWLRWEMLERYFVIRNTPPPVGTTVLEVGSGAHAIATVPLAFFVGAHGRVLALERSRWGQSQSILAASGVRYRTRAVAGDARRLPLRNDAADLAVCIHGVRSLGEDANIVNIFREMLRVAPRVRIVESLSTAETEAQRAHLAMYELREEVLLAATGHRDDLRYRTLDQLVALVESAGGRVAHRGSVDVDLPHSLAFFPRSLVESISPGDLHQRLLLQWDEAAARIRRWGEDHTPVGTVVATRRG